MSALDVRSAVGRTGGLHTIQDLAFRWGISRQRARVIVRLPGFPDPIVTPGGVELWPADEADRFRSAQLQRIAG
jgi:hypothetical protein